MAADNGMAGLMAAMPEVPDFSKRPVRIHTGATPLFGVLLMLAGGVLPIFIYLVLSLLGWIADVPESWPWIKLAFALIPLAALPWGWWVWKSRTVIELHETMVRQQKTTPFGTSSWDAPLSEYTGLVLKVVMPSSTAQDRVPSYVVEMQHPDPKRRPGLTHTKDEALARAMLENVARATGLPVHEA